MPEQRAFPGVQTGAGGRPLLTVCRRVLVQLARSPGEAWTLARLGAALRWDYDVGVLAWALRRLEGLGLVRSVRAPDGQQRWWLSKTDVRA